VSATATAATTVIAGTVARFGMATAMPTSPCAASIASGTKAVVK
jgi:hypothetical protein